jgi:hypothetical protein
MEAAAAVVVTLVVNGNSLSSTNTDNRINHTSKTTIIKTKACSDNNSNLDYQFGSIVCGFFVMNGSTIYIYIYTRNK